MKQYGLVDSADSLKLGIGAMTEARWRDFFRVNVEARVHAKTLDDRRAYTLAFVDRGYRLAMRPG